MGGGQTPKKEPSLPVRGGLNGRGLAESGEDHSSGSYPQRNGTCDSPAQNARSLPALRWKGAAVQALPGESRGHIQQGRMCQALAGNEWHSSRLPVHISLGLQWHFIPGRCGVPSLASTAKCVQICTFGLDRSLTF